MMRACHRGFTLIEVAIVITVATILIAAVLLTGDGVFWRTGVASLLANVKDLATASREFKNRYGYFPGDLPNAGSRITANGGISAGCTYVVGGTVGNGIVDSETESSCALEHLVRAGLLSKIEYDTATTRYVINTSVGVGTRVSLWFNSTTNENVVRVSSTPCEVALDIERKLDSATSDNKPFNQGSVTGRDGADAVIETCTTNGTNDPVARLLIKY